MIPLLDRATYSALRQHRHDMENHGVSCLSAAFMPVGPDPAAAGPIRLLFVGQATRGRLYDGDPEYEQAISESQAMVEEWPTNTPWSGMVAKITRMVLELRGDAAQFEAIDEIVGWSNLCKIGVISGNPTPPVIALQQDLCRRCLIIEHTMMQPTATILMTGDFARSEIFDPLSGTSDTWTYPLEGKGSLVPKRESFVAVKHHPKFGELLWTYHPAYCRRSGTEKDVTEFVARHIAAIDG